MQVCDTISSDDNPVEGLKVGTIFSLCQFTSTSVVRTKALSKKYKIVILAPKGTNGACIEGLSAFPKQREFLIDRDLNASLNLRDAETYEPA